MSKMAATSTSPRRRTGGSERGQGRERRPGHGRSDRPHGSQQRRDQKRETREHKPEKSQKKGSFSAGFGQTFPLALAGAVIIIYFVWMCTELGSHSHNGLAMLAGTFGAIFLGVLAAGLAAGSRAAANRAQRDR
jgi:hypothetical protein